MTSEKKDQRGRGSPVTSAKSRTTRFIVLAAFGGFMAACCGVGAFLLRPAIQQTREARRRQQAAEDLRQIGLGLRSYHDTYAVETTEPAQAPIDQKDVMLNPDFPVVECEYRLTTWSVSRT